MKRESPPISPYCSDSYLSTRYIQIHIALACTYLHSKIKYIWFRKSNNKMINKSWRIRQSFQWKEKSLRHQVGTLSRTSNSFEYWRYQFFSFYEQTLYRSFKKMLISYLASEPFTENNLKKEICLSSIPIGKQRNILQVILLRTKTDTSK